MSFFIDKHGRRKSPIALAACGAALLDLAVYFCTAALLAGPLYRAVSFGGETITSMLHTIIITVISTLLCCLLFLLKDKRVVPYGFAGLAVILLMFCAAAWMLPVCCERSDLFAIPSIIPVQLMVNAWAEEMKLVPGSFTHGAKVTAIE